MKSKIKLAFVSLFLLVTVGIGFLGLSSKTTAKDSITPPSLPNPDISLTDDAVLAIRKPDEFNWKLLAEISGRASANLQQTVPGGNTTNDALWETWADDQFTFPKKPDPAKPPKWLDRLSTPKTLTNILQQELNTLRSNTKLLRMKNNKSLMSPMGEKELSKVVGIQIADGGREEVRRNEAAFTFIISNNLWYREGLACSFQKGTTNMRPNGKNITFPPEAIEIKAVWKPLGPNDKKEDYHWNYDGSGKLYGLTGLHIISKTVPNWTWVTFEWVGNPGRCDYLGCHDAFGVMPGEVAPIYVSGKPSGQPYPPGALTPELIKVFQDAGFDSEWISEWQNYRLKGSQIDFTSATGVPNLVGNSITEDGFVQTSSCMTCHANAAVDSFGKANPTFGFTSSGQSLNGPVMPQWFYDTNTWDPVLLNYKVNYYPTDFVWAIPFLSKPAAAGTSIPPCS
jgi:hypothetical protein